MILGGPRVSAGSASVPQKPVELIQFGVAHVGPAAESFFERARHVLQS